MDTNRLKKLRENLGLSQKKLAKELNISPQRYNYYETGKREPDHEMLIKIAKYFHVSVDYLLGLSEFEEKIKENKKLKVADDDHLLSKYNKLPGSEKEIIKYIIDRNKET